MNRFPVALFVATGVALTITHFVHLSNILLDHGSLGRIRGESLTRAVVCIPIFIAGLFVSLSKRFARSGRWWGAGTLAIAVLCWADFLVSN
jgi:hypothetical protein